jgi:polyhydroxybutyrate depolymerase
MGVAGGMAFILYVPAKFKANSSALVMALHPRFTFGAHMENLSGLDAKADEVGFAVLYPETPGRRIWNWFFNTQADDVQSLRAIVAAVQANLKADPKRIYALGYSDGAEMAHRVGVEMSDVVAAIAPVSGVHYEGGGTVPAAKAPVSVLMLHADLPPDLSFYVCGRAIGAYLLPSQDEVFDYWTGSSANACTTSSTTQRICSGGALQVVTKGASGCKGSAEVQFYQLLNAQHGWFNTAGHWSVPFNVFGAPQPYNPDLTATTGLTANDIIWNFFAAHPKP